MKGMIFTMLEDFVCELAGPDTWERVLASTTLETKEPFVGPGSYPDADLVALAVTSSRTLGVELPDALRAFGRFAFPRLMAMLPPHAQRRHTDARTFLMAIEREIHTEVRKLHREATPPTFRYQQDGDDMVLIYDSARRMCPLVQGLLDGTADHFGVRIEQTKLACMLNGADACRFRLRFEASP